MNNDLTSAKELLVNNGYTCVLFKDGNEFHSFDRGVKPLIDFLESGKDFDGFYAADKTVGAGAAHIYVLLGVKALWANIISQSGKEILEKNNIQIFFGKQVPYIINRSGDGVCPIESSVKDIKNSNEALSAIKEKLKKLNSAKQKD